MTLQEFQVSFSPILNRWKRAYSGDQLQLIYEVVKTLSKADFDRVVADLLGRLRVSPMIPDFRDAINSMGLRLAPRIIQDAPDGHFHPKVEDYVYHVQDNIWANNDYVFIRGPKSSFIIKALHRDHPLVVLAESVKEQKVKEAKEHIRKNTYSLYLAGETKKAERGLRPLNFELPTEPA